MQTKPNPKPSAELVRSFGQTIEVSIRENAYLPELLPTQRVILSRLIALEVLSRDESESDAYSVLETLVATKATVAAIMKLHDSGLDYVAVENLLGFCDELACSHMAARTWFKHWGIQISDTDQVDDATSDTFSSIGKWRNAETDQLQRDLNKSRDTESFLEELMKYGEQRHFVTLSELEEGIRG